MLRIQNISKSFGDNLVLNDLSFDVDSGSTLAILGPSGCGKSTLLKIISGLIEPDLGTIIDSGQDVTSTPTHLRGIGFVFQDNQLFPHLDVTKNIEFGLKMAGWDKKRRQSRVAKMLETVGLTGFEKRTITDLSGGEAKRVALARSLAPAPKVLLLDEPLTNLDEDLHDQLMLDLKVILKESNTTTVLVTHDKVEAQALASAMLNL